MFGILVLLSSDVSGHEIVGVVTPLMIRMERMLKLIDNGLGNEAMDLAKKTYNDFHDQMRGKEEQGLQQGSLRIDHRFGTDVESMIHISLNQKDPDELQKGLRLLSFLLMMEKALIHLLNQINQGYYNRNFQFHLEQPLQYLYEHN